MDARRKAIIWACALLTVATCLYAPWAVGPYFASQGYGWLFEPPSEADRIDFYRLAVEWSIIGVMGGALYAAWPGAAIRRIWFSPSVRRWVLAIAIFIAVTLVVRITAEGITTKTDNDDLAKLLPQLRDPVWWWVVAIAVGLFTSWKTIRRA